MLKAKLGNGSTIARGDSLAEQVFTQLSRTILSGGFAPNDRINLRQLARDYEVSVTPVREAVLRLSSDGVLHTTERNSIIVPQRSEADIHEIFEIRRSLEGDLAEAAANKLTSDDVAVLTKTQQEFITTLHNKDYRDALRLNAELHFLIYNAAQMPIRYRITEIMWLWIGPTLRNMYPILNQHDRDNSPHDDILQCAASGDATGLRKAVIADLNRAEKALIQYLQSGDQPPRIVPSSGELR